MPHGFFTPYSFLYGAMRSASLPRRQIHLPGRTQLRVKRFQREARILLNAAHHTARVRLFRHQQRLVIVGRLRAEDVRRIQRQPR